MQEKNLEKEIINFLDEFFIKIEKYNLEPLLENLDHVAYQSSSKEDYEKLLPIFNTYSKFTTEVIIGNRKVSVFELIEPINYKNYHIIAIELIEPKAGQLCSSGWEHVEFVLNKDFEDVIKEFPDIDWNKSSMSRDHYSHLKLRIDENTQLKFHKIDIVETVKRQITEKPEMGTKVLKQ